MDVLSTCDYRDTTTHIIACLLSQKSIFGSGALSGKLLLVRIIENNKIAAYFRHFRLSKGLG